jgi:acetyl-CoA decarbonylase/synthase complex subunit delta
MGYGHTVISSSPIDVNLAKQVNILLENLGMPMNRVIVDPTTGGLGYGLEYTYSVMERLKMAALAQGDDKLQFPIINNLGNEIWKCKEAKLTVEDAPLLGDPEKRGILLEAVGAVSYLMSGSSILIMRHPEAIKLVKAFIDLIADGGSALKVAPIKKRLDDVNIDFAKLAPKADLTIEEEKAKPAPKAAAPKAEAPKAAAAPAPKAEAPKAAAPALKAQAEADAKAKADAEAKAKAAAEVKARAEAEAATKAAAEAIAAEYAKRDAEEAEIRAKRAAELEKLIASRVKIDITFTAAAEQKTIHDRMLERLVSIHRKAS